MKNNFVDYLNSMNNASSNTIAALAESQVLSEYYEKIQIERNLGNFITDSLSNGENKTFVLTGHAGDGKTSILVQVLRELNMLSSNTALKEEETYEKDGIKLYAVKDMSELPEEKQLSFCKKALEAPLNNSSAIVISNTGPLLKCLENIQEEYCREAGTAFDEKEKSKLQTDLLSQLDNNENKEIKVGKYSFLMINIARVDNVIFAEKIIEKLLADELWTQCLECNKRDKCPIHFNITQMKKYRGRVCSFINAFYRYLFENDKRMTIRQMMSQISFAITGNKSCDKVENNKKFEYLFPNLFFGYRGIHEIENADQIQGIAYARDLALDSVALKNDYELFVSGKFDLLPSEIRDLVEKQYKLFSRRHINIDEFQNYSNRDYEYRKSIRRTYIFFEQSCQTDSDITYNPIFDELFGEGFNVFIKLQNGSCSHSDKKTMNNIVLNALYSEMTGTFSKQINEIPLTIKRDDSSFQNVMITKGTLNKKDIKIDTKKNNSPFEDSSAKNEVLIRICDTDDFKLSLPMVIYFKELANGAVSTTANPSLTHGISKLKAMLEKCCYTNQQDGEISIIVNSTDEPKKLTLYVEDKLSIE